MGEIATVPELTQTTLVKLMTLINDKRENVSGEAVVSIQKLIQINPERNEAVIKKLARLFIRETAGTSNAKCSILWLVGEYANLIPKVAPDVLRVAAKAFIKEVDEVKMHTLTLAAKMSVQEEIQEQVALASTYVFNLARYDQSYDLRDRARFLKNLIFGQSELSKFAKDILTAEKPVPEKIDSDERFRFGTISSSLGIEARMYSALPTFAVEASPSSLRELPKPIKPIPAKTISSKKTSKSVSSSESESESESEYESEDISGPDDESESESESDSCSESESSKSEEELSEESAFVKTAITNAANDVAAEMISENHPAEIIEEKSETEVAPVADIVISTEKQISSDLSPEPKSTVSFISD